MIMRRLFWAIGIVTTGDDLLEEQEIGNNLIIGISSLEVAVVPQT